MYDNIIQQEQNRKSEETKTEGANQDKKIKLLGALYSGDKSTAKKITTGKV